MSRSTISLSDRKIKYPKIGGPRKYPSMYCWSLIGVTLRGEEVRYFKSGLLITFLNMKIKE